MPFDVSGIYLITNIVNGKIYIGSAVKLKRRWIEHRNRLRSSTHHNEYLQRAWNKYGEDKFIFSILQYCKIENLLEIETSFIKFFQATNEKFGYNSCETGRSALGRKHKQETKDKIGAAHKGKKLSSEQIEAMKKAFTGRKRDPEVVKRIAKAQTGIKRIHKPKSDEHKAKIKIINTELANRRWAKYRNFELDKQIKI